MRWQKLLRFAIGVFVVVFATIVVVSLRRGHTKTADVPAPKKRDPNATIQGGAGQIERADAGKVAFSIKFGNQLTYADGRNKFGGGVTVVIPDKNGRSIQVESRDAETMPPPPDKPDKKISTGSFTGGVKLTTSDGIVVTTSMATYNDDEQMTRIPGALKFSKGRMTGSGFGGTYDQTRNVLWILDQAKVDVTPDKKSGGGEVHVTAKAAGMARNEHYMKFTGQAHLEGEGHVTDSEEATVFLTPDDEKITRLELRNESRITSKPGASGPQAMRAKDIDMTYADDGRTLQSAHLVENAAVQLPGDQGKPGKRIAAKGIDIALAPDGETVTSLNGTENVQVDLPADGDIPARRIRSQILIATGAPAAPGKPGGINSATFGGSVDYRESRPANAKTKTAAIDRTARAEKLEIQTKPGFGDLERAEFHNNVHFTDGPQTTAEAPNAVYSIAQDNLDLTNGNGDVGKGPHVSDGRVTVDAVKIHMGLTSQKMKADTQIRSVMVQDKNNKDGVKVPSMLKQDQPVYVRSNRLDYDSAADHAVYEGNAKLWQDGDDASTILADTITIDDKTGNLHATTNVTTDMPLTQADDKKTGNQKTEARKAKPAERTLTKADELLYEDDKHRATYTGSVHMNGPNGDVTAAKIELFLAAQGGQLERAEADGSVVSKQELRRAFGKHLTYVAKDDLYTMVGVPAMVYDDTAPNCKVTKAPTVTFSKEANTSSAIGGTFGQHSEAIPCGSGPGSH